MATTSPQSPPRRRSRFWLRFLVLIAIILAAPLGWFAIDRLRADRRLRAAYAEADRLDPGWRERSEPPDAENGALQVVAAVRQLPKDGYAAQWTNIPLSPTLSKDDQVTWRHQFEEAMTDLPGNVMLNAQQQTALPVELEAQKAALAAAREVKKHRNGRFKYTTYKGWPYCPDMEQTRTLSMMLHWDVLWQSHRKDWRLAVDSARAAFGLPRAIGDQPDAHAQLLRATLSAKGCAMVERLVGQGEPPASLLAALREDIRFEGDQPQSLWMLRGARIDIEFLFRRLHDGSFNDDELERLALMMTEDAIEPLDQSWFGNLLRRVNRDWTNWRAGFVEGANRWTDFVKLPVQDQINVYGEMQVGARFFYSGFPKAIGAGHRTHAQLRATEAGLAVECYRQKHGRWPERLDDLTPDFWDAVPIDIYTGKPLVYRRHKDGVVVYSIGPDEQDNGGKLRREPDEPYVPYPEGLDFGMMLWDVAKRRAPARPPLPLPAPQVLDGDKP